MTDFVGFDDDAPIDALLREKNKRLAAYREVENAVDRVQRRENANWTLPSADDMALKADAQARCDAVAMAWGTRAPAPMRGEALLDYRVRLMAPFKKFSPQWKTSDVGLLARSGADINALEGAIYADALSSAARPELPAGHLHTRIRPDRTGRDIKEFYGDWRVAFAPFLAPIKVVTAIGDSKMRADAAIERLAARGAI